MRNFFLLPARRRRRPARIQRPHDPNPWQHRVTAVLDDQHQRLDRRVPCERVVLALRQLRNVVASVAQGAQVAAIGQGDRVGEGAMPALFCHQANSDVSSRWSKLVAFIRPVFRLSYALRNRLFALAEY